MVSFTRMGNNNNGLPTKYTSVPPEYSGYCSGMCYGDNAPEMTGEKLALVLESMISNAKNDAEARLLTEFLC